MDSSQNKIDLLCQFESQKSLTQQLYLPVYEKSLFKHKGPKFGNSNQLKCQQNWGVIQQSEIDDNPTYLSITSNNIIQHPQYTNHSMGQSSIFIESKPEVINLGHLQENVMQQKQQSHIKRIDTTEFKICQNCNIFRKIKDFQIIMPCHHQLCCYCIKQQLDNITENQFQTDEISCLVDGCNEKINSQLLKEQFETNQILISEIDTKTCDICFRDLQITEFKKPLECNHEFCTECIYAHLQQCVLRSHVLRITCPQIGCQSVFSEEAILSILDAQMIEKYKYFHHRELISQNKNARWCPKVDCQNYVIGNGNSLLICQCGQRICFHCSSAYHDGLTCDQAADQTFLKARLEGNIYDCPKCKVPIQKKGGCNHMTCYKCKYDFCWICRGKYTSVHYALFNIFGCAFPGTQSIPMKPLEHPMMWRILTAIPKIFLTLLVITILLTILPFVPIYLILVAPYKIIRHYFGINALGSNTFLKYTIALLLGIILSPITIIVGIICGPCLLISALLNCLLGDDD